MIDEELDFAPDSIFQPIIFKRGNPEGEKIFKNLIATYNERIISDHFELQVKELFKIRNPKKQLSTADTDHLYNDWSKDKNLDAEGCWVFYPWLSKLIHILDKNDFIELRTNRNFYKITPAEQNSLSQRTIGIIGLSVGHSVAITLATERTCGSLKLADFDTLELSNLNRIKTGIQNLGLKKCIITAREIAEIDPYLNIECYTDGLDKYNITDFLCNNGKLDLLIDECDDLLMKILCREEAKKEGIPVIMETSDRGMLDVERFDIEKDRPILHGMLNDFPMQRLHSLTNEQKVPLVLKIVDVRNASSRGKASMMEVGQSIGTWPQLASAVTLGGAVVTDVSRRILLGTFTDSGRYYVDLEKIVFNKITEKRKTIQTNPYQVFDWTIAASSINERNGIEKGIIKSNEVIELIRAACQAPSTGNDQPWKWVSKNNRIFLFHDRQRSWSFGNFDNIAANISFGAAIENLTLEAAKMGYKVATKLYPEKKLRDLVAILSLSKTDNPAEPEHLKLADFIYTRCTNRNSSERKVIPEQDLISLQAVTESVKGASLKFYSDENSLELFATLIGECDRIRVFNPAGYNDLVNREMKWSKEEAELSGDGIDINTLGMSAGQLAAMSLIRDEKVLKTLSEINGGGALLDGSRKTVLNASAIGMITMPEYSPENFVNGGMAMERMWLRAEQLGYAIHPLISPFYLFPRITHGNGEGLDGDEISKLQNLRKKFEAFTSFNSDLAEVFLFKIAVAERPAVVSYRLPLEECLMVLNETANDRNN